MKAMRNFLRFLVFCSGVFSEAIAAKNFEHFKQSSLSKKSPFQIEKYSHRNARARLESENILFIQNLHDRSVQESTQCLEEWNSCFSDGNCYNCIATIDYDVIEEAFLGLNGTFVVCQDLLEVYQNGMISGCDIEDGFLSDFIKCEMEVFYQIDCGYEPENEADVCVDVFKACTQENSCALCLNSLDESAINDALIDVQENGDIFELDCSELIELFDLGIPTYCNVNDEASVLKSAIKCLINSLLGSEVCLLDGQTLSPTISTTMSPSEALACQYEHILCFDDETCASCMSSFDQNVLNELYNDKIAGSGSCLEVIEIFRQVFEQEDCDLSKGFPLLYNVVECLAQSVFDKDFCGAEAATMSPSLVGTIQPISSERNACLDLKDECLSNRPCDACFGQSGFDIDFELTGIVLKSFDVLGGLTCSFVLDAFSEIFDASCNVFYLESVFSRLIHCIIEVEIDSELCSEERSNSLTLSPTSHK